jgi:hypothetical protein
MKFQYKVLDLSIDKVENSLSLERELALLGNEGWELASVLHSTLSYFLIFKRKI